MCVILAVTRKAIRCQRDLGNVLCHVAGMAIEAAVGPGQRVASLRIVIKAPSHPTIRVVTERTICAQATFMMLVPVTGGAHQRRVLETQ